MLTIRRALEAKKAARENGEEAGFSLIELIIVVVILGILVAIAIPIIGALQHTALVNSAKAAAANGATQVAAQIAQNATVALPADNTEFTFAWKSAAPTTLDTICVVATSVTDGTVTGEGGTGC